MIRSTLALFVTLAASLSLAANRPNQKVILAFDGSKDVGFWQESRDYAADAGVKFTYFVNATYFLADADKNKYDEPQHGKGKSAIGFGGTKDAIATRLKQVEAAMDEGHEMASHGNGHYDGSAYSQTQWEYEFKQFAELMNGVWDKYSTGNEPDGWKAYWKIGGGGGIIGFRAPQLGIGNGVKVYKALNTYSFEYDTSRVDKMEYWPKQIDGIWNFPLAGVSYVDENGNTKNTISMDYNFYAKQTGAVKGNEAKFPKYQEQMFKSYMGYFRNNYYGNRAPIHIGHHFSKWNGGAYWKAMKQFADEVCDKEKYPDVDCITYKELVDFMNDNVSNIEDFQKAKFDDGKKPKPATLVPLPAVVLSPSDIIELQAEDRAHWKMHEDEEQ